MNLRDGRWALVVLIIWSFITLYCLSAPFIARGEGDSREVLTLRRDLVVEKIMRIDAQLQILRQQYVEGQRAIEQLKVELETLNKKLEAMEPKRPKEVPKPEGKK